jgi:hypothetical protein
MLKTLVLAGLLLLAGAFFIAATTGASASLTDEFVIPLDEYLNFSNNLTVHLIQVTVSNITYYTTYSPDPVNTIWPILVFQYENHGNFQVACRFHVQIVDNTSKVPAGWTYDKTDETIYQPLYPNQNSSIMTMEFAMPKNLILTNLSIIDDGLKKEIADFPIVYPTPTPTPTPSPAPGLFNDGNGENLRNLLLIPILLGLVGLIGWFMARKRLF